MKNLFFAAIFAVLFSFRPLDAQGAVVLSVSPTEGGGSLRFGRGDLTLGITKEVRVRITATENVQYQVFQSLIEPLTSERGITINRPVLAASIVPGTNGSGTVYLQDFERVGFSEQLVYTSAPGGLSDAFTIVYRVNAEDLADDGSFSGKLLYVLRPIGSGSPSESVITVFIESSGQLHVETEASVGTDSVRLDSQASRQPASFKISFSGNGGDQIRIYQEVLRMPANEVNRELEPGVVKFSISGGAEGDSGYQSESDLSRNWVLVYQSASGRDTVSMNYRLDADHPAPPAGRYQGLVRYTLETDRVRKDFDVDLDIDIAPVFEIAMEFPSGKVDFPNLLPGADAQIREVRVKVRSNLGKPYVVSQNFGELLTNEKGQPLAKEHFMVKQELIPETLGKVSATEFVPVAAGDSPLFYSDAQGSPADFRVFYRLAPYPEMQPGDYRTSVLYSLNEM